MNTKTRYILKNDPPTPWYTILILVVILLGGLFVGNFLGLLISILVTDMKLSELATLISPPLTADKRLPLMIIQGMGALGGFIVGGILYLNLIEKYPPLKLLRKNNLGLVSVFLAIILVISFMFVNTLFIEWNAEVNFPDFLKWFENWARAKEDELKRVTEFLTVFDSFGQFLLGFVVIAILPAFGEELIFRGILQNKLHIYFRNAHAAIWIAAILFSGFHIQFYGFIPRLLLGVLFGYMYYWSSNLWYPVIAHFINNGFTLTMIYFYQIGIINVNIEQEESYSTTVILIFAVITIYMLYSFRKKVIDKPDIEYE